MTHIIGSLYGGKYIQTVAQATKDAPKPKGKRCKGKQPEYWPVDGVKITINQLCQCFPYVPHATMRDRLRRGWHTFDMLGLTVEAGIKRAREYRKNVVARVAEYKKIMAAENAAKRAARSHGNAKLK